MKRFFALAALLLGLAACQTEPEGLDVNVGGAVDTTITVAIPEGTRAKSDQGFDLNTLGTDYSLRYILEIYRVDDSNGTCQRHVLVSDNKSVAFPVRLAPGYGYNIVVWADIVKGDSTEDRYYDTSKGLDEVTIIEKNGVAWNAMNETRDAYTATVTFNNFQVSQLNTPISLTRPFAKLRVVATDIEDIRAVGLEPTATTVTYSQDMYRTFNARTGEASNASTKSHNITYSTSPYTDANGEFTLFADYFFVPSTGTAKFNLTVKDADGNIINKEIGSFNTEIFVQRNKLTTIKGDVLTAGGNVKVEVENDGKLETINYADNAETLQQIINAAPADGEQTNITLGGDIDLGDLFGASILSTRATATLPIVIAEGKVVVLDLNGHKITTPWEDEAAQKHYYAFKNYGSLTIQDSNSNGNGEIIARGIFNYGTMTLKSGTINACDGNGGYGVRNYEGAEFIMNGGSIVTSKEDGDDRVAGNYDASPLRVDEGATATINGGNITNISNYTVAIDNYGTTTINGGNITSVHSTVSNSGTMTIKGDATTIKCEGEYTSAHPIYAHGEASVTTIENGNIIGNDKASCYYVAVENNPKVYIYGGVFTNAGQAAFTGEGTIVVTGGQFDKDPSERVVEGYKAVEQNGIYTIVEDPAAMIGSKEYLTLQAAIEAVQDGETIILIRDIEQVDGIIITDKKITIDLNKKTFTVSEGANTNNRNFKVNGTSEVTIKNGTMVAAGDYSSGAYGTLRTEGTAGVTLNGVKLYNYRGNGLNVKALSGTTVTINDSEIYSQYGGGVEAAGGAIELTNVKIEQKGMYTAPYNSMTISVNGGGTATVNSGTYSTECITAEEANNQGTSHGPWCAGVLNSGGTLIIKGGTFSNDNFGDDALATNARGLIFGDTASKIVINDGTFNALKTVIDYQNNLGVQPNPNIVINGGNFSANPAVVTSYGGVVLAEGKVAAKGADGRWTLVDGVMDEAGLKAAFEKGGNIVLGADITVAETVILAEGKTAVLNLNGKTITHADEKNKYAINNLGTLTITGEGTVNSRGIYNGYGNGKANVASATLTIENGTFNAKGENGGAAVFNYGTANINGGSFTSIGGYSLNNQTGSAMTIAEGVTANNGVYTSDATLTINGGEISGNRSGCHVIYCWNANITINGGKFYNNNSGNSTVMAAGTTTITYNGGNYGIKDGRVPGNGNTWTSCLLDSQNSATVIVNNGTYNGGFRVQTGTSMTINGGSFNDCYGSNYNINGTVTVKGGTYTDATAIAFAKKYVAEGYEMNANGEVVAK